MKHPFKNTINLKVQDDIKLNLEKEKLRQEIIALKRPLYKNPSFLIPLIGLLLGILTASFTVWSGLFDVKKEKLENQKLVLQIEIDTFKKEKDSLTQQNILYIHQNDSLSQKNVLLNKILKSSKEEINKTKKDFQLKIESTQNEINKISSKFTLEKESIRAELKEVNKLLGENNCNAAYSKLYKIMKRLNGITKGDFSNDFSDDFDK